MKGSQPFRHRAFVLFLVGLLVPGIIYSQRRRETADENGLKLNRSHLSALKFRSIGPAIASGRIADFAVNPENPSEYYVGVASGGLWKTEN